MASHRDNPPDDAHTGRRPPPHDPDQNPPDNQPTGPPLDHDTLLLGGLLQHPPAAADCTAQPHHLNHRPLHQAVHETILLAVHQHGADTDLPRVLDAIRGRSDAGRLLRQLRNGTVLTDWYANPAANPQSVGYHADHVIAAWQARALDTAGQRLRQHAATVADGGAGLADAITRATDELAAIARGTQPSPAHRANGAARALHLTPASAITPRRVRWAWRGRLPLGELALLAGKQGLGKSSATAWMISMITRGMLPGDLDDTPRPAIIAATEDSWEYTIVPRLVAAGADLSLVFRVDVRAADHTQASLSLPADNEKLEKAITDTGAGLVILDPLVSRIEARLNTNSDAEVRQALEPLADIAHRTHAVMLGLIHLNKGAQTDPLTAVMASTAFTAVPRAVLVTVRNPEEPGTALLGQPKNNLGRTDLPILKYRVNGMVIGEDDGPIETSYVEWLGETPLTLEEALHSFSHPEQGNAVREAAEWLDEYLDTQNGRADRSEIVAKGRAAGHSKDSLDRARTRLGLQVENLPVKPRRTQWVTRRAAHPVIADPPDDQERERYV